ncbi:MAG: DUF1361 domain-containing protein [Anaerolineae bacterium]|jgi:uncharacterized membrane protein|nr:DUF1361 domain-containing protein [Anaerolineae bacterium]MBT7071549.1 DUF1361 domain-containing protein [Anaerolineae bacterium]MBT7326792.1 DUF1361 domain-containing protein [Anaerolineae bacterium]
MFKKLYQTLLRHRYKLTVFVILAASSATCISLVGARVAYSDSGRYISLIWNLFLAWIPFVLAYLAYALSWRRWLLYFVIPIFAFLWLIFFPNAPYLITDVQHLADGLGEAPVWYDVILLIWFSWTGLLLGIVSLYLMQQIVKNTFSKFFGWLLVFSVSILSSIGVYLGRFLRWNSWDIWQNPIEILRDAWKLLRNLPPSAIGFTALFSVFFLFVYLTLYAFGHLLQEDNKI